MKEYVGIQYQNQTKYRNNIGMVSTSFVLPQRMCCVTVQDGGCGRRIWPLKHRLWNVFVEVNFGVQCLGY